MREGDNCNFCGAVLDANCDVNGPENPAICELKEQYWTTPMTGDEMLQRLYQLATPEQLQRADPEVTARMRRHAYTRTAPSAPPADAGRRAADKWLENWRRGR